MCDSSRKIYTEPPETKELNIVFAWGATAIGIGQTQAEEMFSVMNIPITTKKHFILHERKVEDVSLFYSYFLFNRIGMEIFNTAMMFKNLYIAVIKMR